MTVKRLYVLRHGDAGDKQAWRGSDDDRPLSEIGIKRTTCVVEHLVELGIHPGRVVTSPLVRAAQTADLAARALTVGHEPVLDRRLGHAFDAADLADILEENSDVDSILIVGHEPSLSAVISAVIGGGSLIMKKSGIARVDLQNVRPPAGELVWLASPTLFGR